MTPAHGFGSLEKDRLDPDSISSEKKDPLPDPRKNDEEGEDFHEPLNIQRGRDNRRSRPTGS